MYFVCLVIINCNIIDCVCLPLFLGDGDDQRLTQRSLLSLFLLPLSTKGFLRVEPKVDYGRGLIELSISILKVDLARVVLSCMQIHLRTALFAAPMHRS